MSDKIILIKKKILEYIKINLPNYIKDESKLEYEKKKLYSALKDFFESVPPEKIKDIDLFVGVDRWNFLTTNSRKEWGIKFLTDIYFIINEKN